MEPSVRQNRSRRRQSRSISHILFLFISFIAIDVFKVKEKGGLFSIFNFEETSEKKQIENTLTEIEINEKLNGEKI